MPLDGVKALLFDVFGTVVDWRSGVAREAAPFLARHAPGPFDSLAFADAWRQAYQPAMKEVRSRRRPFTRLDLLHRENLEKLLPEFGINAKQVPAAELDELNLAWHRLEPWTDVFSGLTRLRTRYIIAPLSNGNIILLVDMAKHSGIPWDAILGAELVQAYKPTPEAYLRTVELLMMKPEQVCLGRRAQQGPCRSPRLRLEDNLYSPPTRVRSRTEDGPDPRAGLGHNRR